MKNTPSKQLAQSKPVTQKKQRIPRGRRYLALTLGIIQFKGQGFNPKNLTVKNYNIPYVQDLSTSQQVKLNLYTG